MSVEIIQGDCVEVMRGMADASVHCCVTSPPYFGLRDYGVAGQIGLEPTPDEFVAKLVEVFREVRRVLRDDGTLWLNLGDSYAANRGYQVEQTKGGPKHGVAQAVSGRPQKAGDYGLNVKDLIGIPWRVAFALQADGWYLRQEIIWAKPNAMPESVRDRCTNAHESIFLLAKSKKYYFDAEAIAEPSSKFIKVGPRRRTQPNGLRADEAKALGGFQFQVSETRHRRSVWTVKTKPFKEAHFATFPPDLIEPCVLAGCPAGGMVLDPFGGAGTTGLVAQRHGRDATLIELNPEYVEIANNRIIAGEPNTVEAPLRPSVKQQSAGPLFGDQ